MYVETTPTLQHLIHNFWIIAKENKIPIYTMHYSQCGTIPRGGRDVVLGTKIDHCATVPATSALSISKCSFNVRQISHTHTPTVTIYKETSIKTLSQYRCTLIAIVVYCLIKSNSDNSPYMRHIGPASSPNGTTTTSSASNSTKRNCGT